MSAATDHGAPGRASSRRSDPSSGRLARLASLALASLVVLVTPTGAHAQAEITVLATTSGLTHVSAYGSTIAFSKRDPATGRYRLVAGRPGGTLRTLAVPSRKAPFDVDLGPGRDGALTAVYSRCAVEPDVESAVAEGTLDYSTARRCRLYRYVFSEGRERVLGRLAREGGSAFLPTVWRDRIAYASAGATPRAGLFVSTAGGAHRRRLPRGPAGDASSHAFPLIMDLRGTRLAFTWANFPDTCDGYTIDPEARVEPLETALYVTTDVDRLRRVASACNQIAARFSVAGAAWRDGVPVTGLVTLSGRSFGLDVLAAREGSSNAILGGYAAGEMLADSLAVVGASVVAAVRVRPADQSDGGSRVIMLPPPLPRRANRVGRAPTPPPPAAPGTARSAR